MKHRSRSVTLSVADGLATVRIAREHGNAIDTDMVDGLRAASLQAAGDPEIRGVLLAASGKLFCPGLDLQELISYDRTQMQDFMTRFNAAMLALYSLPQPLVAAISGHALAGGCLMALTADRRVLRRGALVGLNTVRVGVPLPYGVAQILRESVQSSHLGEIALSGRNYTDEEAVFVGIVHEIHAEEGFEDYCKGRLEEMASRDSRAFATTKRYLRSPTVEKIRVSDPLHLSEFLDCWFSEATRRRIEGIVAELQNRGD